MRLPHPWDSPGKNMSGLPFPSPMHKSESEDTQSYPTLSDPMDCKPPGSSVHGIFQARVRSGLPLPSLRPATSGYKCKLLASDGEVRGFDRGQEWKFNRDSKTAC